MRDELLCLLWSILCVRVRFGAEGPPLELVAVDEVARLLLSRVEDVGVLRVSAVVRLPAVVHAATGGAGGCWIEGTGGSWKRVLLTRITPCSSFPLEGVDSKARPLRWKRI